MHTADSRIKTIRTRFIISLSLFLSFLIYTPAQSETVKIAMCQIMLVDNDKEGNIARIDTAMADATAAGAQIACFAECVLWGWANPIAHTLANPIPGADSDRMCALALKYGVYLCVGIEEKSGTDLYDSVILINPQGQIILKHRKVHNLEWLNLMTPDYKNGDGIPQVIVTEYGRIGLLICADTGLAWLVNAMAAAKPDILLVPFGWAAPDSVWPDNIQSMITQATYCATTCKATLIGTDALGTITNGPWTGWTYGGQSSAISNTGVLLAKGADRARDIVMVSVPYTPSAAEGKGINQRRIGDKSIMRNGLLLLIDGKTGRNFNMEPLFDIRGRRIDAFPRGGIIIRQSTM